MDENETKPKLDALGKPVLDQQGDTPSDAVEVRKALGKLIPLRTRAWVRVKPSHGDFTSIILPTTPEAVSLALKGLLESVLAETGCITLAEVLRESNLDLIVTADIVIPRTGELRLDTEKQLGDIIEQLLLHDMAAETSAVQEYGYWTIPLANVALALIPCESDPVDYQTGHLVLETPLSDIQSRYEKAQAVCNRLVTERDEWIQDHLNPLLDDLKNQLLTESLPSAIREEAEILRRNLEQDAEKLAGVVDLSADFSATLGKIRNTETGVSDPTPSSISAALAHLRTQLDKLSGEAQSLVQTFLDSLVESTAKNPKLFPTLDDKKEFAKGLQAALDHVGLTILTSKGNPGRLDAYPAGGTHGGGFRLQATPSKNTENLRLPLKRPLVVAPKQLTDASLQRCHQ